MSHLVLLELSSPPVWLSAEEVGQLPTLQQQGFIKGWMDITSHQQRPEFSQLPKAYPSEPTRHEEVSRLVDQADTQRMSGWLEKLTEFHNRYYIGSHGTDAVDYILRTATDAVTESGRTDVKVHRHVTSGFEQDNVVVRISGTSSDERVVLGAHLDSINSQVPMEERPNARAPGADDDGSGSAVVMEVFRTLLFAGYTPERTVEFQWYAAEEVGLLGSQQLADEMAEDGVEIYAFMQSDMCGGSGGINLIEDFTDESLNVFHTKLIDNYLNVTWQYDSHGYASSDHASFGRAGYPTSFPFESGGPPAHMNCAGHTEHDSFECVDIDFAFEWVKLGLSFVSELSPLA